MQTEMSKNNKQINAFESEINHSLHEMSNSLNTKFKICQDFDNRVVERMDFLQESFRSQDLQQTSSVGFTVAQLEHDRQQKELQLTKGIVQFNKRVTQQIATLEKDCMGEISGLSVELQREEQRRSDADKDLFM